MAIKSCAFKGCDNSVINNVQYGRMRFTLFSFPKEEERRKLWKKLGQVSSKIPENQLFMCSDHFDRKYISVNQRRTLLVGVALPYAYEEPVSTEEVAATSTEDILLDIHSDNEVVYEENSCESVAQLEEEVETAVKLEIDNGKEYQVESTTMRGGEEEGYVEDNEESECELAECEDLDQETVIIACTDDEAMDEIMPEGVAQKVMCTEWQPVDSSCRKRKLVKMEDTQSAPSIKNKVLLNSINQARSAHTGEVETYTKGSAHTRIAHKEPQCVTSTETESLIDVQHVTTFIFKGEEFVQMPKEYYEHEKLQLLQRLNQYEKVLRGFKQQLNTLGLS